MYGKSMNVVKVRKNFLFDKETVEKAQQIIRKQHKSLTEAITLYLKAVAKDPTILHTIEERANKRTGAFIGMLDGEIGDGTYKSMKKEALSKKESLHHKAK